MRYEQYRVFGIKENGQLPYLQKKVANLTSAVSWLENEIKKKEYNLSTLNSRTRELTYRADKIYPTSPLTVWPLRFFMPRLIG